MSLNTFRLVTLGRLDLLGANGAPADPSLSARRRKIALLVVLASAKRPVSKDTLVEMFWGEQDEARARHSLSDALSHVRRVLGRGSVVAKQSTAELDVAAANLSIDATEFAAAVKAGNNALALELYVGPFLDGVHVDGSSSFEHWVAAERNRLSSLFGRACARRAEALFETGTWDECAEVARRWLDCEAASSAAARLRLLAIAGPGTREAAVRALHEYERLTARLQADLGLRPDASVAQVARELDERIRANELPAGHTEEFAVSRSLPTADFAVSRSLSTAVPVVHAAHVPDITRSASNENSSSVIRSRPQRRVLWIAAAAVLLISVVSAAKYLLRGTASASGAERTAVALTDFEFAGGDSTQSWMADGLRTMLASKLSRSTALELISPERVREIAGRAEYSLSAPLGSERSRDIGLRAGANWVVSGALSGRDTTIRLELTVSDVKSGKVLRVSLLTARDMLALADAAAAQLLDVVDPAGSGARLADLETSSLDAYQHFVAYVRYAAGVSNTMARAELDKALALDSGFISAIIERRKVAVGAGDSAIVARMDALFAKHEARATFWDRTTLEAERIFPLGEVGRTLALYRELVVRYPRDPRAYNRLWGVLTMNGDWVEAEKVALRQLAIDSLATTAGNGICAPCVAYSDLAATRLALGDARGAEDAARRLLQLQPDLGGGHSVLAQVLLANGKYDEGLEEYRRARALNPEDGEWWVNSQARHLIIARRLDAADSLIKVLERSKNPTSRDYGFEIRSLWWREKGAWPEALAIINQMEREGSDKRQARLMRGNTLARMGDYAGARKAFETMHEIFEREGRGERARYFAWTHALLGDALAPTGDTVFLKVLADSIAVLGANSYYARDKMLPHYLRALVAVQGNRLDEAEREFRGALYSRNGFTRVNVELARLLVRKQRYKEAEELLLQALMGPLDAMPRYQPRSEVHALLDSVRARVK